MINNLKRTYWLITWRRMSLRCEKLKANIVTNVSKWVVKLWGYKAYLWWQKCFYLLNSCEGWRGTCLLYSPESNGIIERKNRTLKKMMNVMLISSFAPSNLWGEAVLITYFLQNRIPYKKTDKTPYELWKGYLLNLKYLGV